MDDRCKGELFDLAHKRMVFAELEALGVDASAELEVVNARIETLKAMAELCGVISSYRKRKRWPDNDLSEKEKKVVREFSGVDPFVVASMVLGV
jgi:hypothetical protein